jgi:D-aminopeptidase
MNQKLRDYGINLGHLPTGSHNTITDVTGVKIGHVTLDSGSIKTGVTAILPHSGNLFQEKLVAACHVINGFGKAAGLVQVEELGTIESPIILTNTLSVGIAHRAVVDYMLEKNEDIGDTTGTINPIIGECNDGVLNEIRKPTITSKHILEAIKSADVNFLQGNVGAGTGMVCYDLKGGIGSASRIVELGGERFTIGILVLSNFGSMEDLMIRGNPIGGKIKEELAQAGDGKDKGSIMVILATDIPLSSLQLKRLLKRTQSGIARTGGYTGNGSGEVAIGFTTANKVYHYEKNAFVNHKVIQEDLLDMVFKGTVEATEEAVLNSLISSNTVLGRNDTKIHSLKDFAKYL